MQHKEVADRVLKAVGGEAAAHCATRLRMVLKDSKKVDQKALDNDPDLKGTFETGGMFQIIVGPGDVNTVFKELDNATSKSIAVSTEELKEVVANSGNVFTRSIKVLADIFVPLIPILVGGGLLMALNNVLTAKNLFGELSLVEQYPQMEGLAGLINLLASAPFAFLPILVGFTATKRFGGNEFLGAGIAMAMLSPDLVNFYKMAEAEAQGTIEQWNLFGLFVDKIGYQGTVLPILVISWVLATIEKFFHKKLKGTADFLRSSRASSPSSLLARSCVASVPPWAMGCKLCTRRAAPLVVSCLVWSTRPSLLLVCTSRSRRSNCSCNNRVVRSSSLPHPWPILPRVPQRWPCSSWPRAKSSRAWPVPPVCPPYWALPSPLSSV